MFSVLLPVYSKEDPAFLEIALQSVFDQTLQPNEIVVVKDGPLTSSLDEVLERYQKLYPALIQIVSLPENLGLGISLAIGLNACSNELVARVDSDDINLPFRFEKQIQTMIEHPELDVVGFNIAEFQNIPDRIVSYRSLPENPEEIYKFGKRRCPINHPTIMFRRSKVLQAGNYKKLMLKHGLEDYYLWMRMLSLNMQFYNIQQVGVLCRIGNGMVNRRHGFQYFRLEMKCFFEGMKIGYIGVWDFCIAFLTRSITHVFPIFITRWIYSRFLRQKQPFQNTNHQLITP